MNINTGNLLNVYPRYMRLTVYVNPNNVELYNRYYEAIYHHNSKLLNSIQNIDAGFDLYVPENQEIFGGQPNRINFGIKCSAKIYENGFDPYNSGYYLHPRSAGTLLGHLIVYPILIMCIVMTVLYKYVRQG
jgi:hypothetical protein